MSFAQIIQDAWNKQAKWLILLRPLSCLYWVGSSFNHKLYQNGVKAVYTAPVPVMVIGNITVGGSGKTPLLIQLIKYLMQRQLKVGVVSRGYGGQGPFPALVDMSSKPDEVGDEPCLIVQSTHVPMAVGADRKLAIELLLSHYDVDFIISDDGLQHWALDRQIEWIVLDLNRGLGNEKLLPEGYLREPKSRLKVGTVIEHGGQPRSSLNMYLQAGEPYLLNPSKNAVSLFNSQDQFYAVVGIGFPQRFYKTLESIGIQEFQCHEFPDHYDYEIEDLQFDDHNPIITTEKDAVKILALLQHYPDFSTEIWVVPVEAILSQDCYQLLDAQLQQLGISLPPEI